MRLRYQGVVCAALLLLVGCMAGEEPLPSAGITPTTAPSADSKATPSPTPTPDPTPTPTPARSSAVYIAPAVVEVWLASSEAVGLPLDHPSSLRLSATVTMSDGSQHQAVTWQSLEPAIASVDAEGMVTAAGVGVGSGPWYVTIQAVASDGKAVGARSVLVHAEGDVAVSVE